MQIANVDVGRRGAAETDWPAALPALAILLVLVLSPFLYDLLEWSQRLSSGG